MGYPPILQITVACKISRTDVISSNVRDRGITYWPRNTGVSGESGGGNEEERVKLDF